MKKQELVELYGTDNIDDIIKSKSEDKQYKVFFDKKPKRVKLTAEQCQKLCEATGLEYLDGYESRVIEHVITDETVDRIGDIIRAKGGDIKNYKKNPVIQFAHIYNELPVGHSIKVWRDSKENNWKSWGLYFDERVDKSGRSDLVFKFIAAGAMPACSVGFLPFEISRPESEEELEESGLGKYGVEFTKWELLEYSPCPVPCNPNALQNSLKDFRKGIKDGLFSKENCELFAEDKDELSKLFDVDFLKQLENEIKDKYEDIEFEEVKITDVEETEEDKTTDEIEIKIQEMMEKFIEEEIKIQEMMEKFIEEVRNLGKEIKELRVVLQPKTEDNPDSTESSELSEEDESKLYEILDDDIIGEG